MALEGLRDRLKEQWAELSAKIQETSAFNTAREKFESQTPTVQKVIIAGAALLFALFLLSFPLGFISTANENLTYFEDNRALIQGLLRASRSAKGPAPLPPPTDPSSLRSMVERVLREKKLVPEQIGDMQAIPDVPAKGLAPPVVVQNGLAFQVKQLNLRQIIDIGTTFQNLGPGIKLIGLDIVQSAGQSHYYDMIGRVVNFGLPLASTEPAGDEKPGARPRRSRPSQPADGGEE